MSRDILRLRTGVKSLTLCLVFFLTSCAYINGQFEEVCKTRAYIRLGLADYISKRYHSDAPVRLGVIPFTVPANLATVNAERPGLDAQLAWRIQAELLEQQQIPIVEFLPRQDWPGKKDEFFTGNYGAIRLARDAGYDLVFVGYVDALRSTTELVAYGKILDTESGVTVWYGKSDVNTQRKELQDLRSSIGLQPERTDIIYASPLIDELARCVVKNASDEEPK